MPVKPRYLKQIGIGLTDRYPEAFSTDFEHNKRAVSELTNIESKPVRNRVAGYVTRRMVANGANAEAVGEQLADRTNEREPTESTESET